MATDINNFLLSLAVKLGELTSLAIATAPRALWTHEIIEPGAADPATVLRVYGGNAPASFLDEVSISVQVWTVGTSSPLALAQAWAIRDAMLNGHERPRVRWTIAAKVLTGGAIVAGSGSWSIRRLDVINSPGVVGRDDRGRHEVPFNLALRIKRTA